MKSYESVVVTKPELSKHITTFEDDGTVDQQFIVIGKEAWTGQGADGAFTAVPEQLADHDAARLRPDPDARRLRGP